MVSSDKMDFRWILNFQCAEQKHYFTAESSTVDVVSKKEKLRAVFNKKSVVGSKQYGAKIKKLTMQITHHGQRGFDVYYIAFLTKNISTPIDKLDSFSKLHPLLPPEVLQQPPRRKL
mmetsp:Transcript_11477/g.42845  ORF Transcript_11477/g.42845 Transcript_11477/m.42845 type:complete len:117 (+) Transcript_11477:2901-3251(+)